MPPRDKRCESARGRGERRGVCARYRGGAFVCHYMIVNREPAKGCVWPVIAPAVGIVRAGAVLRGDAVRARGLRSSCGGRAFLLECLVLVRARHTFLTKCFMLDHACCLPHSAKQDGLRYVPFLFRRGSRSPFVRSRIVGAVIGFRGFILGLCVSLWRSRRRTKGRGNAENGGNGERSRRRGKVRFCANVLALRCFPRGVRWGCAPQTAPKSH